MVVRSDISGPKVVSLDRFHCSPNFPYDLVVLYQFLMYCVMCLVGSLHSYEVEVTKFTSSWSVRTVLCSTLHHHHPIILHYTSQVDEAMSPDNLQQTLDTAQDELSVEKLLDPEGVQCTIGLVVDLVVFFHCVPHCSSSVLTRPLIV